MWSFNKIRRNTPINVRLAALVALLLIFIGTVGYYGIRGIVKVNNASQEINEKYLKRINQLSSLTENLYSIVVEGKNHILALEEEGKTQAKRRINNFITQVENNADSYANQLTRQKEIELFKKFYEKYQKYKRINSEIIKLSETGKQELALELSNSSELATFREMQALLQEMMANNIEKANQTNKSALAVKEATQQRIYIIISIILLLSVLLSYAIIKDITVPLQTLKSNLVELGKGKIPAQKLHETHDEIGQMAEKSNRLTENFAKLSAFISELSKGNYNKQYQIQDEEDVIGKSLITLRDNLKTARDEAEKHRREDELRNWANRGLAKFADILRESSDDIHKLAGSIIKNTIHYIDASQGGIFLINDEDRENPKLELISAYAYNKRKHLEKTVELGEGLIGSCAVEKETIYLEDMPENYLEIRSGMGSTKPESLLLVPLKLQDDIFGVVEIAAMKKIANYEIEFVERLADNITSTLSAARLNQRTQRLLEESKQKSDELSSQEEEMRQNLEEMRATQEQSERREIELRGIISAIDNVYIKCEYDLNGNLITANTNYLDLMGYRFEALKGKNVRMLVPPERKDKFEQIWSDLKNDIPYNGSFDLVNKYNEHKWLLASYNPVKDNDGQIFKFLFLGTDITTIKKEQEKTEKEVEDLTHKQKELNSQIQETRKEYEKKLAEQNNALENLRDTRKTYEYELNEIHKRWEQHLTAAEELRDNLNEAEEKLRSKQTELQEAREELNAMNEKLSKAHKKAQDAKTLSEYDSEVQQRYNNWLRGLDDID